MVINITRWTPPCGCTIELGYDDQEPQETRQGKFVLMNNVCDKHKPLATTIHRNNHQELTKVPLGHIEDAKRINLDGVVMRMANEGQRSPKIMMQLRQCHYQVLQFNKDLDEEWSELVAQPYAFDSHIYDVILKENNQ